MAKKAAFDFLVDQHGRTENDLQQIRAALKAEFCRNVRDKRHQIAGWVSLTNSMARLCPARDAECCKKLITIEKTQIEIMDCIGGGSKRSIYEFYSSMPDLFSSFLSDIYCNWQ